MKAQVITDLLTRPIPRATKAPWLNKRSNKVELAQDLVVYLELEDDEFPEQEVRSVYIVVPRGYMSDWSSIPRPLWFIFPPNYSEARYGAVVHDYIYSHLYWYYSKAFADKVLYALMEEQGASYFSKKAFYTAVRIGGRGGWNKRNKHTHPHWTTKHALISYEKGDSILAEEIGYRKNRQSTE